MEILTDPLAARLFAQNYHRGAKSLALIPTVGPLHEGHRALILQAKELADGVIVANCLNKLQQGIAEVWDISEASAKKDISLCEEAGVDLLFRPESAELYVSGFSTYVFEDRLSKGLLGPSRPNWFRGFITLFFIYYHLLGPQWVVLGQRDFQVAAVLRKAMTDLYCLADLKIVPTQRTEEGLAFSSAITKLSFAQRLEAHRIYEALSIGKKLVHAGVRSPDRVVAELTHLLSQSRRIRIIYAAAIDEYSLAPLKILEPGKGLLAIAVWLDDFRLLDNIFL